MNIKEIYSIREWAPLTEVVERIPVRIQKGLFPVDLNITCIDAVPEYLALGSDAGIVFWYNRFNGEVQKLRAETTTRITCVKIVNSVEYMIAAGNANGQVSVFQIQKELPPDLNLAAPCTRAKPTERYTIRDLHHSAITCCEWSKNGMKLYSGDRQGIVVLTEVDYQSHLTKSAEILSEAYEIVQLSVHKSYLLVSTLYRSIVCHQKPAYNNWHITQVGKKDRKQLVDAGGTFFKANTNKIPQMICGRPGQRFWIADVEGNVEKTLIFKEAISRSPTWEIPILNPKFVNKPVTHDAANSTPFGNFCTLYFYADSDSLLVTHDDNSNLYILNIANLSVEAVARGFRKIIDICVCGKEIFILEGERSLLRLAPMPEKPNKTAKIIFNPSFPPPVPLLGASIAGAFESPVEYEPEEEAVISAEECFELPPIEENNSHIQIELAVESPLAQQNRRLEIFQQISEMDFDNSILHHSGISNNSRSGANKKHKSRERKKVGGIIEIGHAAAAEQLQETVKSNKEKPNSLEFTTNQPTLMDASFCAQKSLYSKSLFTDHLPDVLSPNTLKKTIEMKAKQLAEDLNIPPVHLQPITAEELEQSKALAAAPTMVPFQSQTQTTESQQSKSPTNWQLPLTYPQNCTQVEDAGVQTTPRKKNFYIQDECDFSNGQPIDEICHTFVETNIAAHDKYATSLAIGCENQTTLNDDEKVKRPLQFVPSKPTGDEIDSFLLDFRRARDPTAATSPPTSGGSNTSSEWEFLDN